MAIYQGFSLKILCIKSTGEKPIQAPFYLKLPDSYPRLEEVGVKSVIYEKVGVKNVTFDFHTIVVGLKSDGTCA